jgi:hypothetical protein
MRTDRLFLILLFIILPSCEKGYKEEVFIEKYKNIYGKWQYLVTVGETGFIKNADNTIEFIPFGQFRYNNGKTGMIKVILQNENSLLIDFNSLFPDVSYAYVSLDGEDSLGISVLNGLYSLYVRQP